MLRFLPFFDLLLICLLGRVAGRAFEQGSNQPVAFVSTSTRGDSSTPIPPPPPISMPVWSLACPLQPTGSAEDTEQPISRTSMNIVTFATPVSVAPPKIWAVSLYHGTLTKDSFLASQRGVLQLLQPNQKHLVPVLGKRSGREPGFSKRDECRHLGFPWYSTRQESAQEDASRTMLESDLVELLPDCALYVVLEIISTVDAGDHVLVLCKVVGTGAWDASSKEVRALKEPPQACALDPSTALYTAQLRQEGII